MFLIHSYTLDNPIVYWKKKLMGKRCSSKKSLNTAIKYILTLIHSLLVRRVDPSKLVEGCGNFPKCRIQHRSAVMQWSVRSGQVCIIPRSILSAPGWPPYLGLGKDGANTAHQWETQPPLSEAKKHNVSNNVTMVNEAGVFTAVLHQTE